MASIEDRGKSYVGDRYRVRYRNPQGKDRSQTFPAKADATAFAQSVEVAKRKGDYIDPALGRVTFRERYETWSATTRHSVRPSTRARDESYWRSLIEPTLGDLRLRQIDRDLLAEWVADLLDEGKAPATVVKAHQIAAKVLRSSVPKFIPSNPADKPDYLPTVERVDEEWLRPEQVWKLADVIDERYRALVVLGGFGGLRIGEMLGLRRADIDEKTGKVKVRRTLVEVRGQFIENKPKTKAGSRDVPLDEDVLEVLSEHLKRYNVTQKGYVFTAPQGGPVRVSLFRRRVWAPATKKAGVPDLKIHGLRHSAVTIWLSAGVPLQVASHWAGHASISITADIYGKWVKEDDAQHLAKVSAVSKKARATKLATVTEIGA